MPQLDQLSVLRVKLDMNAVVEFQHHVKLVITVLQEKPYAKNALQALTVPLDHQLKLLASMDFSVLRDRNLAQPVLLAHPVH